MKMHPSITEGRILNLVKESMFELESYGVCVKCGEDCTGVEPDARGYPCEACGSENSVFGAEALLLRNFA